MPALSEEIEKQRCPKCGKLLHKNLFYFWMKKCRLCYRKLIKAPIETNLPVHIQELEKEYKQSQLEAMLRFLKIK